MTPCTSARDRLRLSAIAGTRLSSTWPTSSCSACRRGSSLSRVAPWRATQVLINSCIQPAIVGQCQRNMVQACALAVKSKLAMVDRENLSGSAKARRQAQFARDAKHRLRQRTHGRSAEHTSELQSLIRTSYDVLSL